MLYFKGYIRKIKSFNCLLTMEIRLASRTDGKRRSLSYHSFLRWLTMWKVLIQHLMVSHFLKYILHINSFQKYYFVFFNQTSCVLKGISIYSKLVSAINYKPFGETVKLRASYVLMNGTILTDHILSHFYVKALLLED